MEDVMELYDAINKNFEGLKESLRHSKKCIEENNYDRASLYLITGMSEIEQYQFSYLNYFIKYVDNMADTPHTEVEVDDRIKFDYDVSNYADKFYAISSELIEKIAKMKEVTPELTEKFGFLVTLNKRMLEIAGRWHIQRYIETMEYSKGYRSKKIPKRLPLLKEAFFFADRMIATKMGIKFPDGIQPKRMVFAVQPNSGKSFLSNVFCNIGLSLHKIYFRSSGVIRMTNTGTNAMGFSGQCKNMFLKDETALIYPEFGKYFKKNGKNNMFKKEPLEEWLLADLDPEIRASMFARGRDSSINGLRNDVALVIDDLSDGFDQMNNDQAHKDMVSKYDVDMDSRKEDENVPELIVGTMFNEFDLSNTMIERAEAKYGKLIQIRGKNGNILFPNSYISTNKEFVMVTVDCFDEHGESIAPKLISTERLLDKQNQMKPYEFDLVYRQKRSSREPRILDYNSIFTYDRNNTDKIDEHSVCVLDPTRKRLSDYFALNCYHKNLTNGKWRFTNCICVQKSLGRVNDPKNTFADEVVDFLINNKCTNLYLENNVSTTLGTLLEDRLRLKGYTYCKIEEVYNSEKKDVRILDMEATIKNHIEFPCKNMFPLKHPMTIAMNLTTRYDANNYGQKGNYDDEVDCHAMFAKKFIYNVRQKAVMRASNLPSFL